MLVKLLSKRKNKTETEQGCIYRGSRGSLGYPGFWGVIKAKAIDKEIFEDFYL